MKRFPVIIGPTAGGKTTLSLLLAQRLIDAGYKPVEIISADSMQIYRGMDIGTAKPTGTARECFVHHCIDICEPDEAFSVSDWLMLCQEQLQSILTRGGMPIVVGGTHLYIKALLYGLFEGPSSDPALRETLACLTAKELHEELQAVDPVSAQRIHPNDRRRAIRAIEVFRATGTSLSSMQTQWDTTSRRQDAVLVTLLWETEALNKRVNARVHQMLDDGLLDEVHRLHSSDVLGKQARQALGYKQLAEHLEGRWSFEEAVERVKIETRRFVKNQRTWLRGLSVSPPVVPLKMQEPQERDAMQALVNTVFTELCK